MTETYKILAQTNAKDGTQARVVYTVPSNTQASISSIAAINTGSTTQEVAFGVVKSADVAGSVEILTDVQYIAVAQDSDAAAYSDDGITWTQTTMPSSDYWRSVTHGDGRYVAVAGETTTYAYSDDGITWTQGSLPDIDLNNSFNAVAYGGGKYVIVGDIQFSGLSSRSIALYSTDGISWSETEIVVGSEREWTLLVYGDNRFVAIEGSTNNLVAYSDDGITWTETTLPSFESWRTVTYGDGRYVAIAGNFDDIAAYSDDGITWTPMTMSASEYWTSVAYGDGRYVATTGTGGSSAVAAYSDDGINWTAATLPVSAFWASVTYADGRYVAFASNSSTGAYSDDGITWTQTTLPSSQNWRSLTAKEETSTLNTLSNTQTIVPAKEIPAGTTEEFTGGITLSAGDQIRVYSEDEDISVHVYGVEIS